MYRNIVTLWATTLRSYRQRFSKLRIGQGTASRYSSCFQAFDKILVQEAYGNGKRRTHRSRSGIG